MLKILPLLATSFEKRHPGVYRAIAVTCLFVWNALLQATERLAGSSLCHTKLWSEELGIEFSLVDIMM